MAAAMAKFTRNVATWIFKKSQRNRPREVSMLDRAKGLTLCGRCLCSQNSSISRYNGVKWSLDKPEKRKILRKIKAEVYGENMTDPGMEKAARTRKLFIPLDDVRREWIIKRYPHQVMTMASYFGIYDHMFGGIKFLPRVVMDIDYGESVLVHYGNFIEPAKTACEPKVMFDAGKDSLTTLLMVNLGNIPHGDIKRGETVSAYLPPCPVKGTGFHRVVFCLLNQTDQCNFQEIHSKHNSRNLASRSFSTTAFLEQFQSQLDPAGLGFFQATWDKTVTNTFQEIVGMKEPVYDLEPFLTPNQKRRLKVKDVFAKKYTNM